MAVDDEEPTEGKESGEASEREQQTRRAIPPPADGRDRTSTISSTGVR